MENSIMYDLKRIIASYVENRELLDLEGAEKLSLTDELEVDSLDVVEIVVDLEKHFGVSIEDKEVEGIRTMMDIKHILQRKVG